MVTLIFVKLGEYQEQSYLLDPFLEQLVVPVVECFKNHTKVAISTTGPLPVRRIQRLSLLLYQYIMCRGYKTIGQSPVTPLVQPPDSMIVLQ